LTQKAGDAHLETVAGVIESRTKLLTRYQNRRYADRYITFVRDVERRVIEKLGNGGDGLVREVALTLARLMAYKDEYEVARLHSDPIFWQRLRTQFSGNFKVKFHLAPPMLPGRDASGRPRKREFGQWVLAAFRLLKSLRGLRGTPFDVFGYARERRRERHLIEEYRALIEAVVDRLDASNLTVAIELAAAASDIRGYGPVKEASITEYQGRLKQLLNVFDAPTAPKSRTGAGESVPSLA
jgi:indolepyruvate ferredoxin oxidoreductase